MERDDELFVAGCSMRQPLLESTHTVFRGYSSDGTSCKQHTRQCKRTLMANHQGSNKSDYSCASREDCPKYTSGVYPAYVTEDPHYQNHSRPTESPHNSRSDFGLLDALEQFPRRFHLRHSITDNFIHSKPRRNSSTDFFENSPQIYKTATFSGRGYRSDKKLTKLRRAYNQRKRKLNSISDSDSDSSGMAYPSNDESGKTSCKEAFFGKRMRKWGFWFIGAITVLILYYWVYAKVPPHSV